MLMTDLQAEIARRNAMKPALLAKDALLLEFLANGLQLRSWSIVAARLLGGRSQYPSHQCWQMPDCIAFMMALRPMLPAQRSSSTQDCLFARSQQHTTC